MRAVARADHGARLFLPLTFAEGTVVVRAAILDRKQVAAAVVDADHQRSGDHDLDAARRELVRGRNVNQCHRTRARLQEKTTPPAAASPSHDAGRPSEPRARGSRTSSAPASGES